MRFYYFSILSLIPLTVYYGLAAGVLAFVGWALKKLTWPRALVFVSVALALAVAPWVEELWIAYNFGALCRKDAGIFIYKTVEVEGFYDASRTLYQVYNPVAPQTAEYYDKTGYRFYELSLSDGKGGPLKIVHFEKVNGQWTPKVLDRPMARYHYSRSWVPESVAHEIKKDEAVVIDKETNEVLGRYLNYYRGAPWYFIWLDKPTIPCSETQRDTRAHGSLIYRAVLKSTK